MCQNAFILGQYSKCEQNFYQKEHHSDKVGVGGSSPLISTTRLLPSVIKFTQDVNFLIYKRCLIASIFIKLFFYKCIFFSLTIIINRPLLILKNINNSKNKKVLDKINFSFYNNNMKLIIDCDKDDNLLTHN